MKTAFDCIPCFIRQTLATARLSSDDPGLHGKALREILAILSRMDFNDQPVIMGRTIQRLIQRLSGNQDPYRSLKQQFNQMIFDLYPQLKRRVGASDNAFEIAARLALAGNMIDFGIGHMLDPSEVTETIEMALRSKLNGDIQSLYPVVDAAQSILYLGDNCGEIVFDRLFIEQLGPERVTYVVRAAPIINDVTLEDARSTGMTDNVRVIDNGSDAPGTLLAECSPAFMQAFERAEVIIAKGQGNYETLHVVDKHIFFLLKVKCPVVARHIGFEMGSHVIKELAGSKTPID